VKTYSPRDYWSRLARDFAQCDAAGLAPVLHPGAPAWYNAVIDRLQARAWARALALCKLPPNARVLDVGCGTGRWLHRLEQEGLTPFGSDRTVGMLQLAAGRVPARLACAEGQRLSFSPEAFDAVTSVTVIQHIPPPEQPTAIDELVRVLRPGGCLVLFELIRGQGQHIFSHSPDWWIAQLQSRGLTLLGWFGQEFLFFDRALTGAVHGTRRVFCPGLGETLPARATATQTGNSGASLSRRMYWAMRRMAVSTSVFLEPLVERICPGHWATHGVFIFRK
jgi:SAM-dependent methyltransferase